MANPQATDSRLRRLMHNAQPGNRRRDGSLKTRGRRYESGWLFRRPLPAEELLIDEQLAELQAEELPEIEPDILSDAAEWELQRRLEEQGREPDWFHIPISKAA